MKPQEYAPAFFSRMEGEPCLSGSDLIEILQAILEKGVPFRFRVKGFSMSPFIKDGDAVTVSPLGGTLPGLGDVIAFRHKGTDRLVIHRVAIKKSGSVLTKGDNVLEADRPVSRADILGYVTKVERDGKEVSLGLGPERFLIAFLTRTRLLLPLMLPVRRLFRPIITRTRIFRTHE